MAQCTTHLVLVLVAVVMGTISSTNVKEQPNKVGDFSKEDFEADEDYYDYEGEDSHEEELDREKRELEDSDYVYDSGEELPDPDYD